MKGERDSGAVGAVGRTKLFALVSLLASCSSSHRGNVEDDDPDGGADLDGSTGSDIGPEGGTVSDGEGAQVTVPPGALSAPTPIEVEAVDGGYPALPADVSPRGSFYAFTPHGQAFDVPATVTVPFAGEATAELRLLSTPPEGPWTEVAEAAIDGDAMTADVDHFSFFVVVEPAAGPQDICVGIGCDAFAPDVDDSGVVEDVDGALRLDPASIAPHVIWIPSTMQGTVSKIESATREEQARYWTGPEDENNAPGTGIHAPTRTTVDFRGDAFIANMGGGAGCACPGTRPSVTKVSADDCDDRGDGVVQTSIGRDDVLAWPTGDAWDDDCIAWRTVLSDPNVDQGEREAIAAQQVIGLDGVLDEVVWVGVSTAQTFVVLDAQDGSDTGREVDVSPVMPYGATIDRDGFLWSWSDDLSPPTRVNTATDAIECVGVSCAFPGAFCQGIAIDEAGDVWCGGDAHVYRAATDEWVEIPIPDGISESLANAAADGQGHVYYPSFDPAGIEAPWFYRIDRANVDDVTTIPSGIPVGYAFDGISIDLDGFVWGLPHGGGNASVLDPSDDSTDVVLNDCPGGYPVEMAGTGCLYGVFSSADMTPFDIQGAATPLGEYRRAFQCGGGGAPDWTSLAWDADVPERASLVVQARTADDPATLDLQPWMSVAKVPSDVSPVNLDAAFAADGVAQGEYLEVRLTLSSTAHDVTPLVRSLTIATSCE